MNLSDSRRPLTGTTLLIGYDSAWTRENRGAIIGVFRENDGTLRELERPRVANFSEASDAVSEWQNKTSPCATIVLIDQPTIVTNAAGQRPVENIVASPVSLRYGGMQPANTSQSEIFGTEAPIWQFLEKFGGGSDPFSLTEDEQVFETYPVLALIALGWVLPDKRKTGRLPKYNPRRRTTFSIDDWRHICDRLSDEIAARQLSSLGAWISGIKAKHSPRKRDQDGLDACICLLVALHLAESKDCLMVGNSDTGYIVVPHGNGLRWELEERCKKTNRDPSLWVRTFALNAVQQGGCT
jgi:predicted RNase H-like nuclease